jgi:hypothetical protein
LRTLAQKKDPNDSGAAVVAPELQTYMRTEALKYLSHWDWALLANTAPK